MQNIELEEELFSQLRALNCAFSISLEKDKEYLTVEYYNTKKSCLSNSIDDEFYNNLIKLVKSYYINAKVIEDKNYNIKFQLS